jgi:hypothetical protein
MQYFLDKKRAIPAAAGFAVFVFISYFVITRGTLSFDSVICDYIYSLRRTGLTAFFTTVTYLGNWQTISSLCLLFLLLPQTRLRIGVPASAAAPWFPDPKGAEGFLPSGPARPGAASDQSGRLQLSQRPFLFRPYFLWNADLSLPEVYEK